MSYESYLEHHGILGMKWGVRRYRNPDGTLTEAGKKRVSKQYRKYALRAQNDFNNDLTGIRIRTYNHAADKMNNGGIKKYNEDYDKKLGDKAKDHDYSTDEEYIKGYERLFKQELNKSAASVSIEYWESNKNYKKAKAIADKYSLYDIDDIAKSQYNMMNDLRRIAEGKE